MLSDLGGALCDEDGYYLATYPIPRLSSKHCHHYLDHLYKPHENELLGKTEMIMWSAGILFLIIFKPRVLTDFDYNNIGYLTDVNRPLQKACLDINQSEGMVNVSVPLRCLLLTPLQGDARPVDDKTLGELDTHVTEGINQYQTPGSDPILDTLKTLIATEKVEAEAVALAEADAAAKVAARVAKEADKVAAKAAAKAEEAAKREQKRLEMAHLCPGWGGKCYHKNIIYDGDICSDCNEHKENS